jgi:Asp-tRNA(Asn)/Glu-tRNA(Gln) amidotransferase A subunit family amidase
MADAFRQSIAVLRNSGLTIKAIDIAAELKKLVEAGDVIEAYEGARFHEARLKEFGNRLDQPIATLVLNGMKISTARYDETRRFIAEGRMRFAETFKSTPVILTPAAVGAAPLGLSSTGDPRMDAPWTALGTPAISIPMPIGEGLPLGLQLTADISQDARLLRAAVLVQQRFSAGPKIH